MYAHGRITDDTLLQPVFEGHNQRDAAPWCKLSEYADLSQYLGKKGAVRRSY